MNGTMRSCQASFSIVTWVNFSKYFCDFACKSNQSAVFILNVNGHLQILIVGVLPLGFFLPFFSNVFCLFPSSCLLQEIYHLTVLEPNYTTIPEYLQQLCENLCSNVNPYQMLIYTFQNSRPYINTLSLRMQGI